MYVLFSLSFRPIIPYDACAVNCIIFYVCASCPPKGLSNLINKNLKNLKLDTIIMFTSTPQTSLNEMITS